MWICFERLQLCHPQEQFVLLAPGWFTIHATVLTYLNPAQGHLLLRTCIILLIDRTDLFLCATAIPLAYSGSGYSVPTPPLQAFLASGQVGGAPTVWDLDSSEHHSAVSQVASESPTVIVTFDSDAVEEEHTDHVQTRGL